MAYQGPRWNNVSVGNENAGMQYALASSNLFNKALDNMKTIITDDDKIGMDNARSASKANTGAMKDLLLQGKKVDPTGFYDSDVIATARNQAKKESFDRMLRLRADNRAGAKTKALKAANTANAGFFNGFLGGDEATGDIISPTNAGNPVAESPLTTAIANVQGVPGEGNPEGFVPVPASGIVGAGQYGQLPVDDIGQPMVVNTPTPVLDRGFLTENPPLSGDALSGAIAARQADVANKTEPMLDENGQPIMKTEMVPGVGPVQTPMMVGREADSLQKYGIEPTPVLDRGILDAPINNQTAFDTARGEEIIKNLGTQDLVADAQSAGNKSYNNYFDAVVAGRKSIAEGQDFQGRDVNIPEPVLGAGGKPVPAPVAAPKNQEPKDIGLNPTQEKVYNRRTKAISDKVGRYEKRIERLAQIGRNNIANGVSSTAQVTAIGKLQDKISAEKDKQVGIDDQRDTFIEQNQELEKSRESVSTKDGLEGDLEAAENDLKNATTPGAIANAKSNKREIKKQITAKKKVDDSTANMVDRGLVTKQGKKFTPSKKDNKSPEEVAMDNAYEAVKTAQEAGNETPAAMSQLVNEFKDTRKTYDNLGVQDAAIRIKQDLKDADKIRSGYRQAEDTKDAKKFLEKELRNAKKTAAQVMDENPGIFQRESDEINKKNKWFTESKGILGRAGDAIGGVLDYFDISEEWEIDSKFPTGKAEVLGGAISEEQRQKNIISKKKAYEEMDAKKAKEDNRIVTREDMIKKFNEARTKKITNNEQATSQIDKIIADRQKPVAEGGQGATEYKSRQEITGELLKTGNYDNLNGTQKNKLIVEAMDEDQKQFDKLKERVDSAKNDAEERRYKKEMKLFEASLSHKNAKLLAQFKHKL